MASELTRERVRDDVAMLARAGLDTAAFVAEVWEALARAVPHEAACVVTVDPATRLLTSTYKFGDLAGRDERDHDWALLEYGGEEATSFTLLAEQEVPAGVLSIETDGCPERSTRMASLLTPHFGFTDELRMVGRQDHHTWGGIALFRGHRDRFGEAELDLVASLSGDLALGLRSGLLARQTPTRGRTAIQGPVVVVVGPDDELASASVGADVVLAELSDGPNLAASAGTVGALVAEARRYAAGLVDQLPRARLRLASGQWLVLHASPLAGPADTAGQVVVTIEEARPPEIVPLVVAAFGLTTRECEVTQLVLQGVDTREIATTLHMSRYTVQDHLKAVFEKAGVRSRRELVSRIFFDQYAPRLGGELAPSGWFAEGSPA
jgi:DNA-binding CsgD family transcriptional regulator